MAYNMKITNGMASHGLSEGRLEFLNEHFNNLHPEVHAKITINFNKKKLDDPDNNELTLRIVCTYKHPLSGDDECWFALEFEAKNKDLIAAIEDVISLYQKQRNCEHQFERPVDIYGITFPDGRCVCNLCKLALSKYLPEISGTKVIKMSCNQAGITSQYDWGDIFVQGGDRGLVLGKEKAYKTAFVEAFPDINGLGTFIRGEGATTKEAETRCWERYQKFLACPNHEWDRNVNGNFRNDGYAKCTHCGMTATALDPLTKCVTCAHPTTNQDGEIYICNTHYFEQDEGARVERFVALELADTSFFGRNDDPVEKIKFDYLFDARLSAHFVKILGEQRFVQKKSILTQIFGQILHNFYVIELRIGVFTPKEEFSCEDYEKMQACHDRVFAIATDIMEVVDDCKDKSIEWDVIFPNLLTYKDGDAAPQ